MRESSLRLEAAFWTALLMLAGAFVLLAVAVSRDYELALDEKVTFAVQGWYVHGWADPLFDAANWVSGTVPLISAAACLAIVLIVRRNVAEAAIVVTTLVPALVLVATDGSVERPDEIFNAMRATFDGLTYPRIYPSPDGFPSGHVFGVVLVYGLIGWMARRVVVGPAAVVTIRLACACIIMAGFLAPMYAGFHWFTDCLGGAILGAIVLLLSWRALLFLHRDRELVSITDLIAPPSARSSTGASSEWTRTRS